MEIHDVKIAALTERMNALVSRMNALEPQLEAIERDHAAIATLTGAEHGFALAELQVRIQQHEEARRIVNRDWQALKAEYRELCGPVGTS